MWLSDRHFADSQIYQSVACSANMYPAGTGVFSNDHSGQWLGTVIGTHDRPLYLVCGPVRSAQFVDMGRNMTSCHGRPGTFYQTGCLSSDHEDRKSTRLTTSH